MKRLGIMLIVTAALLGAPSVASATAPQAASGTFDVDIDFATLTLAPVGNNCLLTVSGELQFEGDLEGTAAGTTSALVRAPCGEVAVTPPGTFPDVFSFAGVFSGTLNGAPVEADLVYQGRVEVGGNIQALMRFSDELRGVLMVEAIVAVGGSYEGRLRLHE